MVEVAAVALATAEGTAVWSVPGHQSAAHATRAPYEFPRRPRPRFFSSSESPLIPSNCTLPKDECRLDTFVPMSRFVRYAETTIIPLARDRPHGATLIVIRPNAHLYTVGVTQRGHRVPTAAL